MECSILIRFQATTTILKIAMTYEREIEKKGIKKVLNNRLNKDRIPICDVIGSGVEVGSVRSLTF